MIAAHFHADVLEWECGGVGWWIVGAEWKPSCVGWARVVVAEVFVLELGEANW
jgi:hypothetical protein